jgi:hypothetical protein
MAKQTFTTGQVLTAAQMTSLQQTAMLGGAASAKTASYTLVAADAGTAISMSNASATTITVNTGLFAAGDTVQITNLGAGVCTITAGTATVNTSASLALAQYESGTLDFTSASAAIFIKGAGPAGGSLTLLSTTTASGSSTTVSGISTAYTNLQIKLFDVYGSSATSSMSLRFNSDSGGNYHGGFMYPIGTTASTPFVGFRAATEHQFGQITAGTGAGDKAQAIIDIYDYNLTGSKFLTSSLYVNTNSGSQSSMWSSVGNYVGSSGITSLTLLTNGGTYSGGTIQIYGVK